MIQRVWRGWTTPENGNAYERLLRERVFPGIAAKGVPGYKGIRLLRRKLPSGELEFMTIMSFDSLEAVKAFAGEDYEKAYVPQAARLLLSRFDETSAHYEVLEQLAVNRLMRFPKAIERDPEIEAWMNERSDQLGAIAKYWFDVMRDCGDDVRELLHDGHPTACVADAAFAYVNAFTAHVNVGFFHGAELPDPNGLLEGAGKFMRHVKLRPEGQVDVAALRNLVQTAYTDMKGRLREE